MKDKICKGIHLVKTETGRGACPLHINVGNNGNIVVNIERERFSACLSGDTDLWKVCRFIALYKDEIHTVHQTDQLFKRQGPLLNICNLFRGTDDDSICACLRKPPGVFSLLIDFKPMSVVFDDG